MRWDACACCTWRAQDRFVSNVRVIFDGSSLVSSSWLRRIFGMPHKTECITASCARVQLTRMVSKRNSSNPDGCESPGSLPRSAFARVERTRIRTQRLPIRSKRHSRGDRAVQVDQNDWLMVQGKGSALRGGGGLRTRRRRSVKVAGRRCRGPQHLIA